MSELFGIKPFQKNMFILPKEGHMLVPGLLVASDEMLKDPGIEKPLDQVRNVACLPGIVGYSIAMPDIHWGYGFAIGGVAAMDAEEGVISPGGVGYDINCGVRLALVPLQEEQLTEKIKASLLEEIFRTVPSGVGHGQRGEGLSNRDYESLLVKGSAWSVSKGFGYPEDLEHTESKGCIEGASPHAVTREAKERGRKQLGSIGSGNHFVEIGSVEKIFCEEIAAQWNLQKGQIYVLIHSGSRGFGHQICQDTLNRFMRSGLSKGLPDPQLVCAPIKSEEGRLYFEAMAAAANFAFNNRQQILHEVRQAFSKILAIDPHNIKLLYDVCHNIAKFETHRVEGKDRKLCVHRKGATRAFGPGAPELSPFFKKTGQPVLVPGDMGRASHLLAGLGNPLTFCSCCHGAGRAHSRVQSMKTWKGKDVEKEMRKQGVIVRASSIRTIAEEMPDAYKDVDMVVDAAEGAKLAKKIARLRPFGVVKG